MAIPSGLTANPDGTYTDRNGRLVYYSPPIMSPGDESGNGGGISVPERYLVQGAQTGYDENSNPSYSYSPYTDYNSLGLTNMGTLGSLGAFDARGPNTIGDGNQMYFALGDGSPGKYYYDAQRDAFISSSSQGDTKVIPRSAVQGIVDAGNGTQAIITNGVNATNIAPPKDTSGSLIGNALFGGGGDYGLLNNPIAKTAAIMYGVNNLAGGGNALNYTAQDAGAGAGGALTSTVTPVTDGLGASAGSDIYGYTSQYNPAVDYAAQAGGATGAGMTGNQLGLYQMGQDMGLSGPALDNWVATGGGATIAGGAAGTAAGGGSWMDSLLASAGKFGTGLLNNPAPVLGAGLSTLGALYGASQIGKSATNAANTLGAANTNAANLASNASLAATDLQRQQFQRQQELQQPFYNAGVNALPYYASGVMPGGSLVKPFSMADYQADPGYGFRFDQGMKALNSSMASRGLGVSGPAIKGAINFGQGAASQEYQNAYNRYVNDQATQRNALAGLTGYGPTAASTIGAAGQNYASNTGNIGMTTANTIGGLGTNTASQIANADLTGAAARQSAYGGAANAFASALNPNPLNAFLARSLGSP